MDKSIFLERGVFHKYINELVSNATTKRFPLSTNTIFDISESFNSSRYIQRMKELHIINNGESFDDGIKRLSRFIFCPSQNLQKQITNYVKRLPKPFVGFQLRFAGRMANRKEGCTFLSSKQIPSIESRIQKEIRNGYSLYICSDSSRAIDSIKKDLTKYKKTIYYMTQYKRSHSGSGFKKNDYSILKGTIFDLGVLSFSNHLYTTKWSSYGDFASALSSSISVFIYPLRNPYAV